jgi:hypothetical protein
MKKIVFAFVAGAFVAAVPLQAYVAQAASRSFSAFGCAAVGGSGQYDSRIKFNSLTGQVENLDTVGFETALLCPVTSDSTVSTTAATAGLNVYGWANGDSVASIEVRACRAYFGGGGGTCGNFYFPTSSSVFGHDVDTSAWAGGDARDGYFVSFTMFGPDQWNSDNVVWSYELTN